MVYLAQLVLLSMFAYASGVWYEYIGAVIALFALSVLQAWVRHIKTVVRNN